MTALEFYIINKIRKRSWFLESCFSKFLELTGSYPGNMVFIKDKFIIMYDNYAELRFVAGLKTRMYSLYKGTRINDNGDSFEELVTFGCLYPSKKG